MIKSTKPRTLLFLEHHICTKSEQIAVIFTYRLWNKRFMWFRIESEFKSYHKCRWNQLPSIRGNRKTLDQALKLISTQVAIGDTIIWLTHSKFFGSSSRHGSISINHEGNYRLFASYLLCMGYLLILLCLYLWQGATRTSFPTAADSSMLFFSIFSGWPWRNSDFFHCCFMNHGREF